MWHLEAVGCPFIVTLDTYAATFFGIVCRTERESKPSTVTVVLTLRYVLWIVYLGVKGESTRSCVDDGTIL